MKPGFSLPSFLSLLILTTCLASASASEFSYDEQAAWQPVTGQMQSPVAIDSSKALASGKLDGDNRLVLRHRPGQVTLRDTGHAWQLDFAPGNWAMLRGRRFELLQMHFHTPAEHTIDNRTYALEGHLVYRALDGRLAVLAVMFEEGAANPGLARLLERYARVGSGTSLRFYVAPLLPATRDYFHYLGSLTTPPLAENVEWYVLSQPVFLSAAQREAIRKIHDGNRRQVQPLNGRPVLHAANPH